MITKEELSADDLEMLGHLSICKQAGDSKHKFTRDVIKSIKKQLRKGVSREFGMQKFKEAREKIDQLWELG